MWKYEERETHCVPLRRIVHKKFPKFRQNDRFAALQIDFGRWRLESFGRLTLGSLTYFESLIQLYSLPIRRLRILSVTAHIISKKRAVATAEFFSTRISTRQVSHLHIGA